MFKRILYALAFIAIFTALVVAVAPNQQKLTVEKVEVHTANGGRIIKIDTVGRLKAGEALSIEVPQVADLRGITISGN